MRNILIDNFDNAYITARVYEPKDRLQIIQVIDFLCAENNWMSTEKFIPTLQWLHAFSETECKLHFLLVAEYKGELVGWCRLFPEQCMHAEKQGELGIGLLSNYRNQKIGSSLLELAFKWAHNLGMKQIDLSVHNANRRAQHLFTKFGFRYISNNGDRFLMSASI